MKKSVIFNIILLISIDNALALVKPSEEFYVNDYADILNEETEDYIINHSKSLAQQTKAQIVVVTVKNLEGKDLESYATDLFRNFKIGDEKENNGLLLLLALEERQFRVEVGYGLEGVLTDGLTGRYQDDYIIPYLKENKWDEGIKNGYSAFYKKVCEYYNIDASDIEIMNVTNIENIISNLPFIFLLLTAGLMPSYAIGFTLNNIFTYKSKRKKRNFFLNNNFNICCSTLYYGLC